MTTDVKKHLIKSNKEEKLCRCYSVQITEKMKKDLDELKFYKFNLAKSVRSFLQAIVDEAKKDH